MLLLAAASGICPAARAASAPKAAQRARLLSPGINMAAPFYHADVDAAPLIAAIAKAGFRHVRLPVSPTSLLDEAHPEILRPDALKRLDGLLDDLHRHKLAVSVDMHDPDPRLWTDPSYGDTFVRFWGALAKHLSARDPESVFLEVVNEPTCPTPEAWNALQGRVLAAMRKAAPRLTLIATGNMLTSPGHWDQIAALQTLKPYPDPNIVYTFHYYSPMEFTHQGASWVGAPVRDLLDIPYPSSPEALAPVIVNQTTQQARDAARWYGDNRWNAAKIAGDIKAFADWASRNHVAIYCGELGVYKARSAEADRLRWYHDVLAALKSNGIPWTIWDDGGGFGVFAPKGHAWTSDVPLLQTLGLAKR
jgi:aryl-phospho-beta-D-glucosidase BglC (GH1 family)